MFFSRTVFDSSKSLFIFLYNPVVDPQYPSYRRSSGEGQSLDFGID
jgi:hypothetical protein